MAEFHAELLVAARRLLARRTGQRGPLPSARIRRSISTSYYALFHFILDEVGRHVVGKSPNLRRRRRMLGRTIAHRSIKTTLAKVQGRLVQETVEDFLRLPGAQASVASPIFAQSLAKAFLDAQSKREEADYYLNKPFSENDARAVYRSVGRAIERWELAKSDADRDFKEALLLLIVLKGQVRPES